MKQYLFLKYKIILVCWNLTLAQELGNSIYG